MVTGSEVVAVVGSNVRRCHLHGRGCCFVFCCFIFTSFELQTLSLSVCVSFSDRFFNGGRQMLPEFATHRSRMDDHSKSQNHMLTIESPALTHTHPHSPCWIFWPRGQRAVSASAASAVSTSASASALHRRLYIYSALHACSAFSFFFLFFFTSINTFCFQHTHTHPHSPTRRSVSIQ
jgi:proteasome lid subunit RPN8/RPN11